MKLFLALLCGRLGLRFSLHGYTNSLPSREEAALVKG